MPTSSKKKQSWFKTVTKKLKKRYDAFMVRRPHRSFRLTRRRDYVRPLALPGNFSFTYEVTNTLWRYKKVFGLLILIYIVLYGVLVGIQSQESYSELSGILRDATTEAFGGDVNAAGQAGVVFLTLMTSGISSEIGETQQILAVLIFLMIWLATVWLLRNLLAGHKVKLRDGLYNSGSPLFAMIVVMVAIIIQLIPVLIAAIGYNAAEATGLISGGGVVAMLFWIGVLLLTVLSVYWVTSSLFAMIIVTIPGMYPFQAIKTAGDMVFGRRIKILLRWVWMGLTVGVAWAVVLIPAILFDMAIKSLWPAAEWLPIVPIAILIIASATTVWVSAYVYLLYRKVIDHVSEV